MFRAEQEIYIHLMKRYVETLYDDEKAQTTFNKLLNQLKFTRSISEIHVKAYFDSNVTEVGQNGIGSLLMEIFDLNA